MSEEHKQLKNKAQARFYHNVKDMADALKLYNENKELFVRSIGIKAFNNKKITSKMI